MILGIDPGILGGIAFLSINSVEVYPFTTENDIVQIIRKHRPKNALIEHVHSMPAQGVVSSFTFGSNFGFYRGVLLALEIPFELVSPQSWQRRLRCLTKGDKNISKNKAQQLYPSLKITHATADALLIATYGTLSNTKLIKKQFSIFD